MPKLLNRGLPRPHTGGHFFGSGKGKTKWWDAVSSWLHDHGKRPPKPPGGGQFLSGGHPGGSSGNGSGNGSGSGNSGGHSGSNGNGNGSGGDSGDSGVAINPAPGKPVSSDDRPTAGSTRHPSTESQSSSEESATAQPVASQPTPSSGAPSGTVSSPASLNTSISSLPTAPTGHAEDVAHHVNIAAIVVPILALIGCALLALFLLRRRRLYHQRNGTKLAAVVDADAASIAPTKSTRTPFAFRGLILPARTAMGRAALLPQRAPLAGMTDQDGSRPVSIVSSAFDFRHPFSHRAVPDGPVGLAASSVGAQLSHDDDSQAPSTMLHPRISGSNHGYGTSVSGSIVGSGIFSLASAHHGHGSTPGIGENADPFADVPARPYSTGTWTDDGGASRSSWTSNQMGYDRMSGGSADAFIPGVDAPPVPHHEDPFSEIPRPYDDELQRFSVGPRDASPIPFGLAAPDSEAVSAPSSTGAVAHYDGSSMTNSA